MSAAGKAYLMKVYTYAGLDQNEISEKIRLDDEYFRRIKKAASDFEASIANEKKSK